MSIITNKTLLFLIFLCFGRISADNRVIQSTPSALATISSFCTEHPFITGTAVVGGLLVTGYNIKKMHYRYKRWKELEKLKAQSAQSAAREKESAIKKAKKNLKPTLEYEWEKRKQQQETRFVLYGYQYPSHFSSRKATDSDLKKHESKALLIEEIQMEWAQDQKRIKALEKSTKSVLDQISMLREIHKMIKNQIKHIISPELYDIKPEQIKKCNVLGHKAHVRNPFAENYQRRDHLYNENDRIEKAINTFQLHWYKKHKSGIIYGQEYVSGYDQREVEKIKEIEALQQQIDQLAQDVQACLDESRALHNDSIKKIACKCSYCKRKVA